MKMIDVLVKQANKEIVEGAILKVPDEEFEELFGEKSVIEFEFNEDHFYGEEGLKVEELYSFDTNFLNSEVELIPPKEKKYLVKFNMRWWIERFSYLNYYEKNESIELNTKQSSVFCKASFTKSELQSIQPVREFLEDMQGKFELVEVEDNEND